MKSRLLATLTVAVAVSAGAAQALLHETEHIAGFQADDRFQRSEADAMKRDHCVEHADVPGYPQLARTAHIAGTVQVQLTVKDGNVTGTKVISGHPMLTSATIENIKTWRFSSLANGEITTKFTYQLEIGRSVDPQNPKVELQLPFLVKVTAAPVELDAGTSQESEERR
jgi:TonB family protein